MTFSTQLSCMMTTSWGKEKINRSIRWQSMSLLTMNTNTKRILTWVTIMTLMTTNIWRMNINTNLKKIMVLKNLKIQTIIMLSHHLQVILLPVMIIMTISSIRTITTTLGQMKRAISRYQLVERSRKRRLGPKMWLDLFLRRPLQWWQPC